MPVYSNVVFLLADVLVREWLAFAREFSLHLNFFFRLKKKIVSFYCVLNGQLRALKFFQFENTNILTIKETKKKVIALKNNKNKFNKTLIQLL